MTDELYRQYLLTLTEAGNQDGALSGDRARLLDARSGAERAAAARTRDTAAKIDGIGRDLTDLERRMKDLQRRYPVVAAAATAPPSLDAYPEEIRSARRELDELDSADAWIRRSQQQLSEGRAHVTAPAPEHPATATPEPASSAVSSSTPRRGVRWYWWAAGAGGATAVGVLILIVTMGGR